MSKKFQLISKLDCAGHALLIEGRPYYENEAGSSHVEIRYSYNGKTLPNLQYEQYYKNLSSYLALDEKNTRTFGLKLNLEGLRSRSIGDGYQSGDTLYLPPSQFSQTDFKVLGDCIQSQNERLQNDFKQAVITSSTFLGLMKTQATVNLDGIARLIFSEIPFTLYQDNSSILIIERNGRVKLQTNYTANNAPDVTFVGRMETRANNKPILHLSKQFIFPTKPYLAEYLLMYYNQQGRFLKDDFHINITLTTP